MHERRAARIVASVIFVWTTVVLGALIAVYGVATGDAGTAVVAVAVIYGALWWRPRLRAQATRHDVRALTTEAVVAELGDARRWRTILAAACVFGVGVDGYVYYRLLMTDDHYAVACAVTLGAFVLLQWLLAVQHRLAALEDEAEARGLADV